MSNTNYTHKAICSVCFRDHFVNPTGTGLNPVRHGFHVIGNGHVGAWHTGPCAGVGFPHFGHSTEGTVWALGQIKNAIEHAVKHLQGLNARPDLSWTFQPTKYVAATWQVRKSTRAPAGPAIERVLKPGTEAEVITYDNPEASEHSYRKTCEVKAPSYEQELASRIKDAQLHLDSLNSDRLRYETAIATWKPAAAVPATTTKVVHKQVNLAKGARPSCNLRMQGYNVAGLAAKGQMTEDDSKVTCQRCKH